MTLSSGGTFDERRKELLNLVKRLRAIGAQADLDLPRVTVIGNQSAGKSSVVEAISRIHVPRDAGTCTRCPMECRMTHSPEGWSCQLSIRLEYDSEGNPLDKTKETPFGPPLVEGDEGAVETLLRKAQFCVLNPTISWNSVLNMSAADLKATLPSQTASPFSRNIICVDLQGPDLVDLSFVDLPGIIQNAEPEMVKLVETMVEDHIRGNCIILVTLPMTDDIENQKALQLARKADPDGRRTIGVLTKPDMLTAGSVQTKNLWLETIEGRTRHKLVHGYYCTRQPDDLQRTSSITPEEARKVEKEFFRNTSPWNTSTAQTRFGTDQLITTVSNLLLGVINDSAAKFRSEAADIVRRCREELSKLPPAINMEPTTYILQVISGFCDDVGQLVSGRHAKNDLLLSNRRDYDAMKEHIRKTAPIFKPFCRTDIQLDGGDETRILDCLSRGEPFYLDDVRKHMQHSVTRELPGNIPFSAKAALIEKFQDRWPIFVRKCFDQVEGRYTKFLDELIEETFKRHALLVKRLKLLAADLVKKHSMRCKACLSILLEMEMTPYTQNDRYLQDSTEKWLARYKDEARTNPSKHLPSSNHPDRLNVPTPSNGRGLSLPSHLPVLESSDDEPDSVASQNEHNVDAVLGMLASLGFVGLTVEDLAKLIPPHPYQSEIDTVAEVRGYFQVAYKRIIDNIPSMIDLKFVKAIAADLQPFLVASFELGTQAASRRCAEYITEDKDIVVKRTELLATKLRLEDVENELAKFGL